ncbi:unnamed protein product [Euphydryas editha]|uniref:Uncharacterized protein n=1 Tax=Euphydryas editha TaxID=104508 RepID=A0AAU9UFR8_EUPED|nr:unnamed protein product [Euphydryas editha]
MYRKLKFNTHVLSVRGRYPYRVIEPVILYASGLWAPAVDKLGIQREFAQKLCKAYRIVSVIGPVARWGTTSRPSCPRSYGAIQDEDGGADILGFAVPAPHAGHNDLEVKCLVDQKQLTANREYNYNIFTDGSNIEGKVVAALSVWKFTGIRSGVVATKEPLVQKDT